MKAIIEEFTENLKKELTFFFDALPSLEEMEAFTMTRLRKLALDLMAGYAEEVDRALYEDRAGRRKEGLCIERRKDARSIQTISGELSYERNYYRLKDGTYCYPVDELLKVERYQRLTKGTTEALAEEAVGNSYGEAARIVTEGKVSRQTVMKSIRSCRARENEPEDLRSVPVLHIDADEDHVSLQNGKKLIVPLISVYEGIEKVGKGRHLCRNVFHYSEEKFTEDFWDNAVNELEKRYDLSRTRVYLHGDGAEWIKQGLESFKDSVFVLDGYHKNKAKKAFFAGLKRGEGMAEKNALTRALRTEDRALLTETYNRRISENPEHADGITEAMTYLYNNLSGISVRYTDPEATNGGATEPHVSHVLSSRLSSRPMGWSERTLRHLVPMLAAGSGVEKIGNAEEKAVREIVLSAAQVCRKKAVSNYRSKPAIVAPESRYRTEVINNGRLTSLYRTIKDLSC